MPETPTPDQIDRALMDLAELEGAHWTANERDTKRQRIRAVLQQMQALLDSHGRETPTPAQLQELKDDAYRALTCLHIAVELSVAQDVTHKVCALIDALQALVPSHGRETPDQIIADILDGTFRAWTGIKGCFCSDNHQCGYCEMAADLKRLAQALLDSHGRQHAETSIQAETGADRDSPARSAASMGVDHDLSSAIDELVKLRAMLADPAYGRETPLEQIAALLTEACVKMEAPLSVDAETHREVAAERGRRLEDVYALVETALMAAKAEAQLADPAHGRERTEGR